MPAVLEARGVADGDGVGVSVLVGAANAVSVRSAAKVCTAWVRISSGFTVTVGVRSAAVAPHALSNKAPIIKKVGTRRVNRNLSIHAPFHKRRYFTWILIFVQLSSDKTLQNSYSLACYNL